MVKEISKYEPSEIYEALNEHVWNDIDGNYDSVQSALIQDKYSPSLLVQIGRLGMQSFLEKKSKRSN